MRLVLMKKRQTENALHSRGRRTKDGGDWPGGQHGTVGQACYRRAKTDRTSPLGRVANVTPFHGYATASGNSSVPFPALPGCALLPTYYSTRLCADNELVELFQPCGEFLQVPRQQDPQFIVLQTWPALINFSFSIIRQDEHHISVGLDRRRSQSGR